MDIFATILAGFFEILLNILRFIFLFGIPIAILAWFIVSLVKFLRCPKEYESERKRLKTIMIISSVVFGIMALAIIGLIVFFAMAIVNM